jgi:hypothetical protein
MENPYEPPPELRGEPPFHEPRLETPEVVYWLLFVAVVGGFLVWILTPTVYQRRDFPPLFRIIPMQRRSIAQLPQEIAE